MDVLFNTINVRDLLSATDLNDPTTPLSAPDLRLLIQKLDSHSQSIKSQVQSYLLSHHSDFSSLFSLCSDAVSQTDAISSNLSDVLSLISSDGSERPIDVEIREVVEEIERKLKEVRVSKELLGLVRVVWRLSERLNGVKEGLRNGQLKFVAEEIRDLKAAVRISDEEDRDGAESEPIVYGLLRKEWNQCFEEIQEVLSRFVSNAVRFEKEQNWICVKYQPNGEWIDGMDLHSVLEAMDVVGLLDYGLARVADLMMKHVITPVINSGSPIAFVEELHRDADKLKEVILKIVPSSDARAGSTDIEMIFHGIIGAVKFIREHVCFRNDSWTRSFGRLTWLRTSDLIISNVLSKVVPEDASKLASFEKIIDLTSKFEIALKELSFISASDSKDERLSNFAENVEVHFASKRKLEILAKTREMLLQCDLAIPQEYNKKGNTLKGDGTDACPSEGAVDLLFLSEKCIVSTAASELMKLVHQTLRDVCLSSTRVAVELYHAARDALLLYEAIVPVKQERQLDGFNQVAVLMHNDFLYLSQEVLGLAFEYRPDFPDSVKDYTVFVDLAPRFSLKGEEILQRHIHLVIFSLKEAIIGADGFQNTHQIQQFESAKFSIDQVIFILEKVHIIWEPLLLRSTYYKAMCSVLDSVFSKITKDILSLDDMAAEETLQLQRLIHLMLESMASLLDSLNIIYDELKPQETTTSSLSYLVPSLGKIRKLAELLDMPLRSITMAWESGELVGCGFTLSEVKDFIGSIFADSPLRKECLWRIENSSV